jgi:hypothetical protein
MNAKLNTKDFWNVEDVRQRLEDGEILIDDKHLTKEQSNEYINKNLYLIINYMRQGYNPFDTVELLIERNTHLARHTPTLN